MKDTVHISKLRGWDRNPRGVKKDDFERLKRQIQKHGQFKPVLATPDGEVIGGNMRLKAYQALGITDVWVSVVDPKDEAEKVAIALADNDRAGYYEEEALAELLMSVPDLVLEDYHLDLGKTLSALDLVDRFGPSEEIVEDEFDSELPENPISALGDLYLLGNHRLYLGDSTKQEDLQRLMGDAQADCVFTDPPYAIYGSATGIAADIADDKMVRPFFQATVNSISAVLKPFGHAYVCCDWRSWASWWEVMKGTGLVGKNMIVWDKSGGLGSMYANGHELLMFASNRPLRKGMTQKITGERTVKGNNVWKISRAGHDETGDVREHNAQKPVKLVTTALEQSTDPGQIAVDFFGGSGTTMIACEQMGRSCYMMEIDPRYADVIVKRWEAYTGQKAEKTTA